MNSAGFDGIVVIQCAGTKQPDAGTFTQHRLPVKFVANPKLAMQNRESDPACMYARPDDLAESGRSWREKLLHYNEGYKSTGDNPYNLLEAWRLYRNSAYRELVKTFSTERVFILSAGWGLISSDFLVPDYNITFKSERERNWIKRGRSELFADFCQLPAGNKDPIVCFGGTHYVWQFCKLTQLLDCRKIVYYNSKVRPNKPGYEFMEFTPKSRKRRTNWHYECAEEFAEGNLTVVDR